MRKALAAHRGEWLGVAAVFLSVCVAYGPAIGGGFVWDDDAHVTRAELRPVQGLWRIWSEPGATQQYYPVLHSAFWLEHRLWADSPLGYHLLNVLLHASAACLFALALRRLWECPARPAGTPGAAPGAEWLAACLFALHPVNVESVAWVSEQKNTLSAVFYLGAAIAYLGFSNAPRQGSRRLLYALGSALFILAILTKSVTATLPAALCVAIWWSRGRLPRRDVLCLLPWAAVGACSGLFTAWMERRFIGAQGPEFALSFLQRCVVAGRALWFYLGKLLWPSGFIFIYPRWSVDAKAGWMCAYPVAALGLLGAAWILWRFRRSVRGPLAAALFFGGSLFPVLGFLNVYPFRFSFVADHFQYLAGLGFFALAAGGAAALWRRLAAPLRPVLPALAAGILGVLGVLTWRLCFDYRDAETLYRATLARNPGAWLADTNLGSVLMARGDLGEAEIHYRAAEKGEPNNQATHFDLGKLLLQQGRLQEAIDEFSEALRLQPRDVEARDNLGVALAETGREGEAEAQFREAIRLQPGNPTARYNLAVALQNGGRLDEAARSYEEALRLRPDYPEARRALMQVRSLREPSGPGELGR